MNVKGKCNTDEGFSSGVKKQGYWNSKSLVRIQRLALFAVMIWISVLSMTHLSSCNKAELIKVPADTTKIEDEIPKDTIEIGRNYYGVIQTLTIGENREFILNGKSFFPIMSWMQSPNKYAIHKSVGINTHVGSTVNPVTAQGFEAYSIPSFSTNIVENNHILAWIFDDEPDLPSGSEPRQSPQNVTDKCQMIRNATPGRLILMTFTANFMDEISTYSSTVKESIYPQYINNADVVGFDYYPVYGWGYPARLDWVGSGTLQLCQLAGEKPVYSWIETSKGSKWMTYEKQPDVLPVYTRNEVWQSIIRGATAIGYFTHAWQPVFNDFAPTEDMKAELARLNAQITRMTPAILASPAQETITMTLSTNLNCMFKATSNKDGLFIFALNSDLGPGAATAKQFDPISPRSGIATFTISGLKAGTVIEVIDEKRTIIAGDGRFTDEFGPLAEHIYRIAKLE